MLHNNKAKDLPSSNQENESHVAAEGQTNLPSEITACNEQHPERGSSSRGKAGSESARKGHPGGAGGTGGIRVPELD